MLQRGSSSRTKFALLILVISLITQSTTVKAQDSEDLEPVDDPNQPPGTMLPEEATPKESSVLAPYTGTSIRNIHPYAGPITGETRVQVRGGPFFDYKLQFPKPKCKFGGDDMIVQATYILCLSDPEDIHQTEARHKDKDDYCLQCDNSPPSLKSGNVTFQVSLIGDFSDCQNTVTFEYYNVTRVFAIYPRYGPKDGKTKVQVWGENFIDYGKHTRCAFGTNSTAAIFKSSTYMICESPFSDVVQKPIPFTVSLNGQQNSIDDQDFWYYSWQSIAEFEPNRGPVSGNTTIMIKGNNFHPFIEHNSSNPDSHKTIDNANDTFCVFEALKIKSPVRVINSTRAICISPPSYVFKETIVELTLNNQQYTDDSTVFYYYRAPNLFDVQPREGPVKGGTKVIAIGSNFRNTSHINCTFNETLNVTGKFLSTSEIECYSPRVDHPGFVPLRISLEEGEYSPAVQYLYYDTPIIYDIEPHCGPDYGFTQITIYGKNFLDLGHNKAVCVFNDTILTNATIMDGETMMCDSPSLLNSQGYSKMTDTMMWYNMTVSLDGGREVASNAQKFMYYKDPKHVLIVPDSGPTRGGTKVNIISTGGYNQEGACNKTARFATWEVKPFNETNDTTFFVYSPAVRIPDTVVVGVALNGQQFSRDLILHDRDVENTFEYYTDPLVTSFTPKSGPNIGGTKISINGLGFTPKKDLNGNPDMKKNRMWIRYVDPDTKEELAPPTEVNNEDLTDDQAIWYTPALPAGTKALMQISLNKQDWHNAPAPKKSYSYYYYESPHIVKLYPTFGPVKAKNESWMLIEGTNFKCPIDSNCTDLMVRFGDIGAAIYTKGYWLNDTFVKCKIPKYTKPDVLKVELTMNGLDYTGDGKTYGYFDPYVLNAEPRLISVEGTTKVRIKGFGFVNSGTTQALYGVPTSNTLLCNGQPCIKDAAFIDKGTLETSTFPQSQVNIKETGDNILWDPMNIDASVYGTDFTENNVEIFYYEEPNYQSLSQDESPANIESQVFIKTDFKKNPINRLVKYSNFTVRFTAADGRVSYSKAQMERYPLEDGVPNSLRLRTPKWDLKGKLSETVKMDISVNGQDFKTGFDFLFTQDLKLHRTVPMAGPNQGNTKTKLIGTGFKPPKTQVHAKWGIVSTDTIPKAQVEEYIYYKLQFENMIEGSEEIKAYVYEASQFNRVDSFMEEGGSYQAVFMQSPLIGNWTKTHGGPYYAEVGKNIEIQYHAKVSTQKNIVINNTNSTQMVTVDDDVIKSWIYYQYDPSNVEYYYYKECVIKDMQPHSGIIAGGTPVSVIGAWFKYLPEYGVVPHCRFGDKIVRGQFDSTVRIVCLAPPSTELGVSIAFEVSLNGIDWSQTGYKFTYYETPNVDSISPNCGPEAGGTMVYIMGSNFTNMSNPSEFNCRFSPISLAIPPKKMPAIFINSTTIMCASPGGWGQGDAVRLQVTFNGGDYDTNNFNFTFFSVTRAFPRSGPSDGKGGDILIEGFGFRNDSNPLCKINNTIYLPNAVSWKQIRCPMPEAMDGSAYFGNVPLSVAPNGKDWNNFIGGFQYYPQPIVDDISPKQGPNVGLGVVNFYGEGFRDNYALADLACKIGDAIGKAVYKGKNQIQCVIDGMELVSEGDYLNASVALNKYSWTEPTNLTHFLPYGVEQIYPNSGPTTGVTDVVIQGKGFVEIEDNTARCRFGTPANYIIVDAQIISYEQLVCKAPSDFKLIAPDAFPLDVPVSIAFTSDEFDPWTESSHKFRFYDQIQVVRCDPCEVEVSTISEILVWTDETTPFFEPVPVIRPVDDQKAGFANFGSGLGGATCQFGRFGETQAIYINETVIKCVTPSVEDDPDSIYREIVKLTVAMNGVNHDESTSQVEFTFVGTGTYLVFWPFIIGALLIGLLIVALVFCCATIFQKLSMEDILSKRHVGSEGLPHVMNIGGGVMVPRGRADWNAERSSVDMIERASGNQFY